MQVKKVNAVPDESLLSNGTRRPTVRTPIFYQSGNKKIIAMSSTASLNTHSSQQDSLSMGLNPGHEDSPANEEETSMQFDRDSQTELDIEPVPSEQEDYNSSPGEYAIYTYPADFTLEDLAKKLKEGDIIIPDFQRQFVWKQKQASKLIESFLAGLPVPPLFLYVEKETNNLQLIDGQQRLKSIKYFFEGYFGEEKNGNRTVFRLKGLSPNSKWNDKSFMDLTEAEQKGLKICVLRSSIIKQFDPNDDSSIYQIFERLNTGGTFLNNQEIRNCIHYGKFNDLLKRLNRDPNYRKILGKTDPDTRMTDQELILRFFSMLNSTNYQRPLKDYMSKYMKANRNPEEDRLDRFEHCFRSTCKQVVDSLGEKPFHLKKGLNAATFDCVMVAFANNLEKEIPTDISERYEKLIEKLGAEQLNRSGTTDLEVVRKRFEYAQKLLFQTS